MKIRQKNDRQEEKISKSRFMLSPKRRVSQEFDTCINRGKDV